MIYNLMYLLKKPGEALDRFLSMYWRSKEQTILRETFVEQAYYPLVRALKEGTVVLDIGGSIGDTAIYFSQFDKVEKVISYEKDQKIFRRGMENVSSSPYKSKISFNNLAMDSKQLDKDVAHGRIAIKCDIEGGEKEVFDGVDLKNVYAIIMETHDSKEHVESLLKKQGFEVEYKFRNSGVVFKEVGLLFAHRQA